MAMNAARERGAGCLVGSAVLAAMKIIDAAHIHRRQLPWQLHAPMRPPLRKPAFGHGRSAGEGGQTGVMAKVRPRSAATPKM